MKKKNDALAPKTSPRPPRKTADVGKWGGVTTNGIEGNMNIFQSMRSANARGLDKDQLNEAKRATFDKKIDKSLAEDRGIRDLEKALEQGRAADRLVKERNNEALDAAAAAGDKRLRGRVGPAPTPKPPRVGPHNMGRAPGAGGYLDNDSSTGADKFGGMKKGGAVRVEGYKNGGCVMAGRGSKYKGQM